MARVGKRRCAYIFYGKTKLPFGRFKLISENNIKVDVGEIRLKGVDLIYLTRD
jgi:hypothetical protein